MILRRNNLRSRSPMKSKVILNKIKPNKKKRSMQSSRLVELPKSTKAIDLLQNSLKKNVLSNVKSQVNILKYQFPKIYLKEGKYGLRKSSCGLEDLLFITSTPNKSEKDIKKSKISASKCSSRVKKSRQTLSNQKKNDETFIQKRSQVLDKKKVLSISPIPRDQKVPDLRKRKKSASVPPKNPTIIQIVPFSETSKSELSSQKSPPLKIRTRSSFSSKSPFIEDSIQKAKSSSFSKIYSKKSSEVKGREKKLPTPLKTVRKNRTILLSKCPLTEDTIPKTRKLASSKNCSEKPLQKNERKRLPSKTKGNIKKSENVKNISNKTEVPKMVCVVLKPVRLRRNAKIDDLNISPMNSTTKKNLSFDKSKNSRAHQFKESSKSQTPEDSRFRKSCIKNINISTPKTSTRSSAILNQTSIKRSVRSSLIKKVSDSAKSMQGKKKGAVCNNSALNDSKTSSKVQQKRRHTIPVVKKKKNGTNNYKNTKKSDKTVRCTKKITSKFQAVPKSDTYFYNINNIPIDDLITTSFVSPSNIIKSLDKNSKELVTSTPLNKKSSPKRKNKSESLSNKVPQKGLPTKGSLKRKRYLIKALKEKSEGYEDDIFESSKFDRFKETLFMDDDSDISGISIATPKCGFLVTPRMSEKTPRFRDCFSPMELMKARKVAEEYMHRRNKKRKRQEASVSEISLQDKRANQQKEKSVIVDPEKKKLDFISLAKSLNKEQDKSEDSDEDVYFSDASS